MLWSWVDAVNLAMDYAKEHPRVNVEKLACELWQDMLEENRALLEGRD